MTHPTDALRLVPVEPTEAMIEAGCRALHAAQGTGDADAPLHSPPQNSWEEPDSVRWKQWRETITDDVWPALVSAAPASPLPGGGWLGAEHLSEAITRLTRVTAGDEIEAAYADFTFPGHTFRADVRALLSALPAAPTGEPK